VTDTARRHHYVPACYLNHVAVPPHRHDGRLYVYDRESGRTMSIPLASAGLNVRDRFVRTARERVCAALSQRARR
jgi:hypothetical protein